MKHVEVNIKKLSPGATIPRYSKAGDAGMDFTALTMTETEMYIEYGTGIAIQLPSNYVGLIYPRSSLSNYDLILSNHVGVVDSGYTGEIRFRFKRTENAENVYINNGTSLNHVNCSVYKIGDKIGQLIVTPYPTVVFNEVSELEETDRGISGFGSSGL